MLNFIYGKETQERSLSTNTTESHLTLSLPGNKENPQDWLILATAEVGGGTGASSLQTCYGRCSFLVDGVSVGDAVMKFAGIADGIIPSNPYNRPMFFTYLKDFCGDSGSATYIDCKFEVQDFTASSTVGTSFKIRNATIFGIRMLPEFKDSVVYHSESGSPLVNLSTTETNYGSKTFYPKKGKYLVISTTQVDFTTTTSDTADVWMNIYQSVNASSEAGATAKLVAENPIIHDTTLGAGLGHFTLSGDNVTKTLKHPITLIQVVDLLEEPCTITHKCRASGSNPDITSFSMVIVPLDYFIYKNISSDPALEITSGASFTTVCGPLTVGVPNKNTFILTYGTLFPYDNVAHPYSVASGSTAGDFNSELVTSTNIANECSQFNIIKMISGVDTVSLKMREVSNIAGTGNPFIKNVGILAFTDIQSEQESFDVEKDIEFKYDVSVPQNRNIIDEATSKALESAAEDARSIYTNIQINLIDINPSIANISVKDKAYKLVGSTYTRDDY